MSGEPDPKWEPITSILVEVFNTCANEDEARARGVPAVEHERAWIEERSHAALEDVVGVIFQQFQAMCSIAADELAEKDKAYDQKPPFRVRVHSGDGKSLLGDGMYVGNVGVYYILMPDGNLQSLHNAEQYPPEEQIPEGARVIHSANNPKIVLDSGDTVYGCQVWWEPIIEKPKEEPVAAT